MIPIKDEIFLINNEGDLVKMVEHEYSAEEILQKMLSDYPNLIPGSQIDSEDPRRWLLVSREMAVPSNEYEEGRWSLDHLFLDQNGVPTLVEVKRSSDTRIRREVVGQMLDYAANSVTYWPIEKIISSFEKRCEQEGISTGKELSDFLGAEIDENDFWDGVKTNLQAGKIRMLFVADRIPSELQRIVEFLNEQMDPAEVLAVEIKQFVGKELKTLVPRLIGKTAQAQAKKETTKASKKWDEDSFFSELEARKGKEKADVARKLLNWMKEKELDIWWGTGSVDGSFYGMMNLNHPRREKRNWTFGVYTYGKAEIHFQWMKDRKPFDDREKRLEILTGLNEIPGIRIPESSIDTRPGIDLQALVEKENLEKFLEIFDRVVEEEKKFL